MPRVSVPLSGTRTDTCTHALHTCWLAAAMPHKTLPAGMPCTHGNSDRTILPQAGRRMGREGPCPTCLALSIFIFISVKTAERRSGVAWRGAGLLLALNSALRRHHGASLPHWLYKWIMSKSINNENENQAGPCPSFRPAMPFPKPVRGKWRGLAGLLGLGEPSGFGLTHSPPHSWPPLPTWGCFLSHLSLPLSSHMPHSLPPSEPENTCHHGLPAWHDLTCPCLPSSCPLGDRHGDGEQQWMHAMPAFPGRFGDPGRPSLLSAGRRVTVSSGLLPPSSITFCTCKNITIYAFYLSLPSSLCLPLPNYYLLFYTCMPILLPPYAFFCPLSVSPSHMPYATYIHMEQDRHTCHRQGTLQDRGTWAGSRRQRKGLH